MSTGKTYSTKYLLDTNNNRGAEGQVLISTSEGVNWSDGSDITGGPYLPLSAGSSYPLTGDLYLKTASNQGNLFFGTADANYKIFGGGTYGYMGYNTGGYHRFLTSGVEKMRITSAGNVGIGTTNPGHKLHVENTESASWTTLFSNTVANSNNIYFNYNNGTTSYGMYINGGQGAAGYDIQTASGFVVRGSGNVGIGTTIPSEKLEVAGKVYIESQGVNWNETTPGTTRGAIHLDPVGDGADNTGNAITFGASDRLTGTNAQAGIYTRSDGAYGTKMYFATTDSYTAGSKTRMMIDYNGNVGIGTTSPTEALMVEGWIRVANNTGIKFNTSGSSGDPTLNIDSSANWNFLNTAGSNLLKIDNGGNVGIGTTSPDSLLHIKGADPVFIIQDTSTGTANASSTLRLGESGAGGVLDVYWDIKQAADELNTHLEINHSSNGNHLTILDGGNVGIGTTTPSAKLDIQGTQGQLFSVTDDLSGDIFSVADISGVPILNVNSDGTSYFDGNVGIGVAAPSKKLEVAGSYKLGTNAYIEYGGVYPYTISTLNTAAVGNLIFTAGSGSSGYESGITLQGSNTAGDDAITFTAGSSTAMVIQVDGKVGIGTTSPGYPLEVDGGTGSGVKIKAGNTANDDSFLVSNNNDVSKFLVQGDGKVIINSSAGVPTRTENFQVFGKQIITNTGTDGPVLYLGYNSSGSNTIQLGRGRTADGLSYMDFNGEVMSAGQYGFRIIRYGGQNASTELSQVGTGAFKVTCSDNANIILNPNSGSVGISQTNPSYKLDVTGDGRFTSTVTAANFILSSDERLKENVEKVCDNKVEADWKTFELKTEKGQKRYGVIAQELEKTNPEFVREDSQGFKSVAYIDLLIAKIAELEARLEKLER